MCFTPKSFVCEKALQHYIECNIFPMMDVPTPNLIICKKSVGTTEL